jgi:hypothetical protein
MHTWRDARCVVLRSVATGPVGGTGEPNIHWLEALDWLVARLETGASPTPEGAPLPPLRLDRSTRYARNCS